jgi:hypothetical protein
MSIGILPRNFLNLRIGPPVVGPIVGRVFLEGKRKVAASVLYARGKGKGPQPAPSSGRKTRGLTGVGFCVCALTWPASGTRPGKLPPFRFAPSPAHSVSFGPSRNHSP